MNYEDIFDQRGELYNQAHVIAPQARAEESRVFVRWVSPQPDETIIVVAAGGGFDACTIANAVNDGAVEVICVEPSPVFSAVIPASFRVYNSPFDRIPLDDGCADAVVNLAAIHHVDHREEVFREWDRLLKPGGRMVIADVEAGSANGEYLNTIVHRYTPGGHKGRFIHPGELSEAFRELGYVKIKESLEEYPWTFRSQEEMVAFSKFLFGMTQGSDEQILTAIAEFLNVKPIGIDGGVAFSWSLRFFTGTKPGDRREAC